MKFLLLKMNWFSLQLKGNWKLLAKPLSDGIKEKYNFIEWYKIKTFRNIITHECFGLSKIQVWTVINTDIPKLKKEIQKILKEAF